MKYLFVFITLFIGVNSMAQSKKEQIAILNYRLDSLNKEYIKDTTYLSKTVETIDREFTVMSMKYKEAQELIKKKSATISKKKNTIRSLNEKNLEFMKEHKNFIDSLYQLNTRLAECKEIELKLDSLQRQSTFYLNWNLSSSEIENALLFRKHLDDLSKSYKSKLSGMGIYSMNDLLKAKFSNKLEYGYNITYLHFGVETSCADCGYIKIYFNNESGKKIIEVSYGERGGYDMYSIISNDFNTLTLTLSNMQYNSIKYLKFITPDIIKFDNNYYPRFDP